MRHVSDTWKAVLIGFGEVGKTFSSAVRARIPKVYVYDVQFAGKPDLSAMAEQSGCIPCRSPEELPESCQLALSLVNSSASRDVAEMLAGRMDGGYFVDLTTSTPHVKKLSGEIIERSGGKYVDGAIMGTVATEKSNVPIVLSGPHAREAADLLKGLGFQCGAVDLPVGGASGIKLLRSVFMKGLEALILETMVAAEAYGLKDEVMDSIANTLNQNEFRRFAEALITTHAVHRIRRSKEIADSRGLLQDADIPGIVTDAVVAFFRRSERLELDDGLEHSRSAERILRVFLSQIRGSGA